MFERRAFKFGRLTAEPTRNLLTLGDERASLEPRVMDVLCALASEPGETVARSSLIDAVWGVEHGADESLTRAISVIRKVVKALGDDAVYIETIPRRGYRLCQPVDFIDAMPPVTPSIEARDASTIEVEKPASGNDRHQGLSMGAIALALSAVIFATLVLVALNREADVVDQITVRTEVDAPRHAIAVLPFEPFSDDPLDHRFSSGITEDLVNALSQIDALAVAARTSSFRFKSRDTDIQQIGESLGVGYLVDGTVRRREDAVRVTAQLIRSIDGVVVWSDVLEEKVSDAFELEDQIVRQISLALQLRLGVGKGEDRLPSPAIDPAAVNFYFEGFQNWGDRFTRSGAAEAARTAFRAATEIEPDFAKAWSALAQTGIAWSSSPLSRDKETFVATLEADIDRALALNPDDQALHGMLVYWHATSTIDLEKARFHLDRAEALAPNSIETLQAGATYHWVVGNGDLSLALLERIQRRDPLSDVSRLALALRRAMLGDHERAFEFLNACEATACLAEGFIPYASAAAIFSGDQAMKAKWSPIYDAFESALEQVPLSALPRVIELNGALYSTGFGQSDAADEQARVIAVLEEETITDHIGLWGPTFSAFLPEDVFFQALEQAHDRGDLLSSVYGFSPLYGTNPYPDWVLEHPRYHALWARPDLAALAEARRANGAETGLPR